MMCARLCLIATVAVLSLRVPVAQTQAPAPPPAAPVAQPPNPDSHYQLGPDSLPRDGVAKGEVRGPYTLPSLAYPGTQHTYWVYVPAQYDPAVPASLMIFNDGQAFKNMEGDARAPNVLDNLIDRREIPVMLAVFINPGGVPTAEPPRRSGRPTRPSAEKHARASRPRLVDEMPVGTDTHSRTGTPRIAARVPVHAAARCMGRPDEYARS